MTLPSDSGSFARLLADLDATRPNDCRACLRITSEHIHPEHSVVKIQWLGLTDDGSGRFLVVKNGEEEGLLTLTPSCMQKRVAVKANLVRILTKTTGYWPRAIEAARIFRSIQGGGEAATAAIATELVSVQQAADAAGGVALQAVHNAANAQCTATKAQSTAEDAAARAEDALGKVAQLEKEFKEMKNTSDVKAEQVVSTICEYVQARDEALDGDHALCCITGCRRFCKVECPTCQSVMCRPCVSSISAAGHYRCPTCRSTADPILLTDGRQVAATGRAEKRANESAVSEFRRQRVSSQGPSTDSPPPLQAASSPPSTPVYSPPPSSPPSQAFEPASELEWSCSVCTTENIAGDLSCQVCGAGRGQLHISEAQYEQMRVEADQVAHATKRQVTEDEDFAKMLEEANSSMGRTRSTRANMHMGR